MKAPVFVGVMLLMGFAFIAPSACTKPAETERQLSMLGFTDVKTTGYDFFACAESDSFSTGFEATSPTGERVSGVYCSGLLKAGTLRFY